MPTHAENAIRELQAHKGALQRLTQTNYMEEQVRDIMGAAGARAEIFLRAFVFPSKSHRDNFESFIDELRTIPIDEKLVADFQQFRHRYNVAKHKPHRRVDVLDAIRGLENVIAVVEGIGAKKVGLSGSAVGPHSKRVFWIVVWDHYAHGDSTVGIFLPAESESWLGPPVFDTICIAIDAWDSAKKAMGEIGIFASWEGIVPESEYQKLREDSDFLGVWVFEGDYSGLIKTLAQFELRQELIPGMNRHEHTRSMVIAHLMASIDVVGGEGDIDEQLVTRIEQQAEAYAVPPELPHGKALAQGMVNMLSEIDREERANVSGPVWVREDEYTVLAAACKAKHAEYDIIVDEELIVRMLWDHI
jgi:hypothetical protein